MSVVIGVYSSRRELGGWVSMLQSRDGSLTLTKKDLIFLLALYTNIGLGGKALLKYFNCSSEGLYFL